MIIKTVETKPDSTVHRELSILLKDTHTPSGKVIHDAVRIESQSSPMTGEVYMISPKTSDTNLALAFYSEMGNRAPALLEALVSAAKGEHTALEVQITQEVCNQFVYPEMESSYDIPMLISWFKTN